MFLYCKIQLIQSIIIAELHTYLSGSSITEVELVVSLRKDAPDVLLHLVHEAADDHGRMLQAVTDYTHVQMFNPISSVIVEHCREYCTLVLKILCLEGEITVVSRIPDDSRQKLPHFAPQRHSSLQSL